MPVKSQFSFGLGTAMIRTLSVDIHSDCCRAVTVDVGNNNTVQR